MKKIIFCISLFLISCTDLETNSFSENDQFNEDVNYPTRQLTSILIKGPLVDVKSSGVTSCEWFGEFYLTLPFINLNTSRPKIPVRNPNIPCKPLVRWKNGMSLECEQNVDGDYLRWKDQFYLYLNNDIHDKDKWHGTFQSIINGKDTFHCIYTFVVEEVELTYEDVWIE